MNLNRNVRDLTRLPRVEDSISYVYLDKCIIEQEAFSIVAIDEEGKTPIPIASITCLLLGPGTSITHAAVKTAAENGCLIVWCGEKIRKFYAYGAGETRSSKNILKQMQLWHTSHLDVVKRMYLIRFPDIKLQDASLEKLRGLEGVRIKQAYKMASRMYGVPWHGRIYKIEDIEDSDDINRALTVANSLLYAVCEAVIVSLGYSPAIGFIHTGHMRSFVYDIADLYKAQIAIPAAFEAVKANPYELDEMVRKCCRKRFEAYDLLKTIGRDINRIFDIQIQIDTTVGIWAGETVVHQSTNYATEINDDNPFRNSQ